MKKVIQYFKEELKNGFSVPLAKDGLEGKPSATLWFAYVSFIIACASQIYFISEGDHLAATLTAIGFWALAMVFYRMGNLNKVSVDLDDREVDLEDTDGK